MFEAARALVVTTVAGLALPGTTGGALATTPGDERDPATITFLVTASGVTLAGVGSAFRGLCAGALATAVLVPRRASGR